MDPHLEGMVVHALGRERVMAVALDLVAQRPDHLRVTIVAALAHIDVAAGEFERAGLEQVETKSIDVTVSFPDFEAFWVAQMPSYSPTTRMIAAMKNRLHR